MLTAFEYLTIISASMLFGILLFAAMISARRALIDAALSSAEDFSLAGFPKGIRLMTGALALFVSGFMATLMLPTFIIDSTWFSWYQWTVLVVAVIGLVHAFFSFGLYQEQASITEHADSGSDPEPESVSV